ncbi:MAG: hypothetical protein ACP5JJ_06950 [Anaerolineae bacterium]
MMQTNSYEAEVIMRMSVEERLREAEAGRLARQAQGGRPGWLIRQGLGFLYRLGRMLIALGQRLQQSRPRPPGVLGSENGARV